MKKNTNNKSVSNKSTGNKGVSNKGVTSTNTNSKGVNSKSVKAFAVRTTESLKKGIRKVRARFADVKPIHLIVIALPIVIALAFFLIPTPLDIQRDDSMTFKDAVADHSRPLARHSYYHSGEIKFYRTGRSLFEVENAEWFAYDNSERCRVMNFARDMGSFWCGWDLNADMDGAYVITERAKKGGNCLKEGRCVYLGKIRLVTMFGAVKLEFPIYMDDRLSSSAKKRIMATFKSNIIERLMGGAKRDAHADVVRTDNGVIISKYLAPKVRLEVI